MTPSSRLASAVTSDAHKRTRRDFLRASVAVALATPIVDLLGGTRAAIAAADPRYAKVEWIMGPITALSVLSAEGGNAARYADRLPAAARTKAQTYGTDYEKYKWNGEASFYMAGVATADPYYCDIAQATAQNYAAYVISQNGVLAEPGMKPQSLACLAATGSADGLRALGLLADETARRFYRLTVYGQVTDELSGRLLTWYILASTYATLLGAPAGTNPYNGQRWDHAGVARSAYEYALSRQNADGSLSIGNSPYFQWGMLCEALLAFRRLYAPSDDRPVSFAKGALAWLFANAATGTSFRFSASDATPAPNDNGFFAVAAAAASGSGDPRGAGWFNTLLTGCLDDAYWAGDTQLDIQLKFLNAFALRSGKPENVSVTPAQTTVAAGCLYTLTSTHVNPAGTAHIARVYLMLSDQNYDHLFRAMYAVQTNRLYVADATGAWNGNAAPGADVTLIADNGNLACAGTAVAQTNAQTLQVGWRVATPAAFAGQNMRVSLFMETDDGQAVGWTTVGQVAVTN